MTNARNQQNEKRTRALNRAVASKEGGLTLLELMISVTIVIIITATAALTWLGYEQRQALSAGVRGTLNLMYEAQGNAVGRINNSDWGVRVTNVSGAASYAELFYGADYASGTVAQRVNFSENVDLNFPREGDVLDVIFAQRTGKANIDLNNIWAAHFDDSAGTPDEFRLARYTGSGIDTSCGSGSSNWECYLLDSIAGGTIGEDAAMAAGADGSVWVSYHDNTNNELVVAKYVGSGGTGCDNSEWTCIDVSDMDIATGTDIVINPKTNQPWISYQDNGNLWLANRVEGEGYVDLPGTSGNYVSTPDFYTPTAELDIRAKVAPDTWSAGNDALVSQWTGVGSRSFTWSLGAGIQTFSWSVDGTNAITESSTSISTYVTDTAPSWIRVTWQQNSGGSAITNYYISNNGTDWTNYDSDTDTTALPMFNATGPIEIGSEEGGTTNPFNGRYYKASLRTSINGPIIAGADFRGRGQGDWSSGSGTDNGGNVWTANGSSWSYGMAGNGVGCTATTEWSCFEAQQSANIIGAQSHIIFNASGFAQVSSFGSTNSEILIAREVAAGAGSGCGTGSTHFDCSTVLDDADTYSSTNDIILAQNGEPWIAYQNATTNKLGIAKLGVPATSPIEARECLSSDWACTELDGDRVKGPNSIAFDASDNAWVAYHDDANGDIRVAQYVGSGGTGCASSAWMCTTVVDDGPGGDPYGAGGGYSGSLVFDNNDNPWISYYNATTEQVRIAQYVGSGGTGCTSSAWTCSTIDFVGYSGASSITLAFDSNNNAWMSYYTNDWSTSDYGLRVAKYVGSGGTGCTSSAWKCFVVENVNGVGEWASLVVDSSDVSWVSYFDDINDDLKVAKYVGSGGTGCASSAWTCTAIDVVGQYKLGQYTSIALNSSGDVWIAYSGGYSSAAYLRIAKYVGSGGTGCAASEWTCTNVDRGSISRIFLAFDSSGSAWVSYNKTNSPVKFSVAQYVGFDGTGCNGSAKWTCTKVESSTNRNASIAFDKNDDAWMSYSDYTYPSTIFTLHIARYVGRERSFPCSNTGWTCGNIDDFTVATDAELSMDISSDGTAWIAYRDSVTTALKIASYDSSVSGSGCANSTNWVCETVDNTADVGYHADLTLGADNLPWISYYLNDGAASDDLVITQRVSSGGAGCIGADNPTLWNCTTVANDVTNGQQLGHYSAITHVPFQEIRFYMVNSPDVARSIYVNEQGNVFMSSI